MKHLLGEQGMAVQYEKQFTQLSICFNPEVYLWTSAFNLFNDTSTFHTNNSNALCTLQLLLLMQLLRFTYQNVISMDLFRNFRSLTDSKCR